MNVQTFDAKPPRSTWSCACRWCFVLKLQQTRVLWHISYYGADRRHFECSWNKHWALDHVLIELWSKSWICQEMITRTAGCLHELMAFTGKTNCYRLHNPTLCYTYRQLAVYSCPKTPKPYSRHYYTWYPGCILNLAWLVTSSRAEILSSVAQ